MLLDTVGRVLRQLILDLSELRGIQDDETRDNLIAEMIGDVTDLAMRCAVADARDMMQPLFPVAHDGNGGQDQRD